jgi:hypothetical protein
MLRVIDLVGCGFDPHMHILMPALLRLLSELEEGPGVHRDAIIFLEKLCRRMPIAQYASSIVHPLLRIMDTHPQLRLESMAVKSSASS